MGRIVLHVGAHRTGSTSIQTFLGQRRAKLETLGIAFPVGRHLADNHVEMHIATLRPERITPFRAQNPTLGGPGYAAEVTRAVAEISSQRCLIFSAEGLSYLRYDDEFAALKALLPEGEVEIIYYVREPNEWLASYRWRQKEIAHLVNVSDEPWLTDFPARIATFREHFERVTVIDYDERKKIEGSVVPSFLRALGAADGFREKDWRGLFVNGRHG